MSSQGAALILIFIHMKLGLADAIHNFKWKLFRIDKIEVDDFEILLIDVMFKSWHSMC